MQHAAVALIVALAALYAVWHWMPGRWRRALASRVAGRSERLADVLAQQPGCGSCETCGTCGTEDKTSAVRGQTQVVHPPASRRG